MPISGVVIRCIPEKAQPLAQILARPDLVEIHGILPDGRLVAVLEADDVEGEVALVTEILATEGVLDVQLAYHHFGCLEGDEEIEVMRSR